MSSRADTIFALSSGQLPSGIAVIRMSGPDAAKALCSLAGRLPKARQATRAIFRDAVGAVIDDGLVLWFPGPQSATGEDVCELHVHGGRAVITAVVLALEAIDGLRPAEAGEFSRRAYENGKLDLVAVEALDDLIRADTERQRQQAIRQLRGLLGDRAQDWRERIIRASALIEAGIDFSDEGDVPTDFLAPALEKVLSLHAEIEAALASRGRSEQLRDGLVVAIVGLPNVGKSTLMNRLAGRDVAIVSPYAGTTRDVIEVHLDLDGYPVTLIDTAGIRESDDPIEQEGVRRALRRASEADLKLWLVDSQTTAGSTDDRSRESVEAGQTAFWVIRNKVDDPSNATLRMAGPSHSFAISALTGAGVAELVAALARFAATYFDNEHALITRARHRLLLRQTADDLRLAVKGCEPPEIVAEHLRAASHSLGRLLGRIDVEDVLGEIFSSFCIGK